MCFKYLSDDNWIELEIVLSLTNFPVSANAHYFFIDTGNVDKISRLVLAASLLPVLFWKVF